MTLAWIVDGAIRCCSDLCGDCDKREAYGCVEVEVRRCAGATYARLEALLVNWECSACGNIVALVSGTPSVDMRYCPSCGTRIITEAE